MRQWDPISQTSYISVERKELTFFLDNIAKCKNFAKQVGKNSVCITKYHTDA
jgi:hypothetical protein